MSNSDGQLMPTDGNGEEFGEYPGWSVVIWSWMVASSESPDECSGS